MSVDIKAARLHYHMMINHPNGLSFRDFVTISLKLGLERNDIREIVSQEYSHMFDKDVDAEIITARTMGTTARTSRPIAPTAPTVLTAPTAPTAPTYASAATTTATSRLEKIALDFYNEVLKDDPFLRQACQDRHIFNEQYIIWKEKESFKRTRNLVGSSPSTVLRILNKNLRIVDTVADNEIIVWRDKPNTGNQGESRQMTRKQRIQGVIKRVKYDREQIEKNRKGMEVELITFELNDNSIARLGTEIMQEVEVTNNSSETVNVTIKDKLAFKKGFTVTGNKAFSLEGNTSKNVAVNYTPRQTGVTKCILSFEFSSVTFAPFIIVRYLSVNGGDPDDFSIVKPSTPFQKKKGLKADAFSDPERVREKHKGSNHGDEAKPFKGLSTFLIPRSLRNTVKDIDRTSNEMISLFYSGQNKPDEEIPPDLSNKLSIKNYRKIFDRLLWIEELTMERDIQTYDMEKVPLERRSRTHYSIHVPGLAESRPSVLRGDKILIRCSLGCFEGIVERTEQESAILLLPKRLNEHFTPGLLVDVRFSFKRMGLRLCHDALNSVESISEIKKMFEQILFPEQKKLKPKPSLLKSKKTSSIVWHNRDLNDEQKKAVEGAISGLFRPLPYVIWGPPGTGQ